ncbi:hypothetical protein Zm00014a_011099 [Zea mays]|uniref:Uncharacterized protein n=1 Tax=Zea mays TaxID=4577 RepID=A0A3L6G1N6_MAIZE|nr:hypothetical protein Zm00014a_011099 [Zea mays]
MDAGMRPPSIGIGFGGDWALENNMAKEYAILIVLISMVLVVSCNVVDGSAADMRHATLPRKGLKEDIKLAINGVNSPVSSISGQASSNSETGTDNDMSSATAFTSKVTTTQGSHRGYEIHGFQGSKISPP